MLTMLNILSTCIKIFKPSMHRYVAAVLLVDKLQSYHYNLKAIVVKYVSAYLNFYKNFNTWYKAMTTRISDFCMVRAHHVRMSLRKFGLLWKENVMVTSNYYDPLAGAIYACLSASLPASC